MVELPPLERADSSEGRPSIRLFQCSRVFEFLAIIKAGFLSTLFGKLYVPANIPTNFREESLISHATYSLDKYVPSPSRKTDGLSCCIHAL